MKLSQPSTPPSPSCSNSDANSSAPTTPGMSLVVVKRHRAPRTCWFEPTLWQLITTVTKRTGFTSPQAITRELQLGTSGALFKTLDRGTVASWIKKDKSGWTEVVQERVARAENAYRSITQGSRIAQSGKKLGPPARLVSTLLAFNALNYKPDYMQDKYPGLADKIVDLLRIMRSAKTIITRSVAQSVALGFIRTDAPDLISDPRFKCSVSFVHRLLHNKAGWSWRSTTQAAQKLPDNWESLCVDLAHRLTWNIALHDVPPELVINADQTGVCYLGTGNKTWDVTGSKQVAAVGKEEKRQFTLMVAITSAGQALPFQAIFKGGTELSLPSKHARKPCEDSGFLFTSGGARHWSTLECMQDVCKPCSYLSDHTLIQNLSG